MLSGADIEAEDDTGRTALIIASSIDAYFKRPDSQNVIFLERCKTVSEMFRRVETSKSYHVSQKI